MKRVVSLLTCLLTLATLSSCRDTSSQTAVAPATSASQPQADANVGPRLREILKDLPENWDQIPAAEVAHAKPFVVDVRDPDEYAKGFIAGAVNIPLRQLATSLQALPGVETPMVLACDGGYGAAVGMTVLRLLGYQDVKTLEGGMRAWQQAKLPVVTSPAPQKAGGTPPKVDPQLQATLDYYLTHTLPVKWGGMSPAELTDDQKRKSSAELDAMAETYDQGRSLLIDVDAPGEFADAKLTKSVNVPLRGLPDGLANMSLGAAISWACGVPDNFRPEPELTRFVMVSTSAHRAAIGMVSMQLLGYHFIRGLDESVKAWSATTDAVVR